MALKRMFLIENILFWALGIGQDYTNPMPNAQRLMPNFIA